MKLADIEKILEEALALSGETTFARSRLQEQLLLPVRKVPYKLELLAAIWYRFMNYEDCQIEYKNVAKIIKHLYDL